MDDFLGICFQETIKDRKLQFSMVLKNIYSVNIFFFYWLHERGARGGVEQWRYVLEEMTR